MVSDDLGKVFKSGIHCFLLAYLLTHLQVLRLCNVLIVTFANGLLLM